MTVNLSFLNYFVFILLIEFLVLIRALRSASLQDQSCTEIDSECKACRWAKIVDQTNFSLDVKSYLS